MYYPFLRGKQNEIAALAMLAADITENNILPILEPIDFKSAKQYRQMVDNEMPLILIVNPRKPRVRTPAITPVTIQTHIIQEHFDGHSKLEIGILISGSVRLPEIKAMIDLYSSKHKITLIHLQQFHDPKELLKLINRYSNITRHIFDDTTTSSYQAIFYKDKRLKVLLRDNFAKRERNKDYPRSAYLFSDIHKTYDGMYDGFGDFTITGNSTGEGGGAAETVAIHFSFIKGDDIMIQHFISDRTSGKADTPGKFREANTHLNEFLNGEPANFFGIAATEFSKLHKTKHFPNLGISKRYSMVRHMEVYMKLI